MDSAPQTPVSKRLRTESNEASTVECQSTQGSNDSIVTTSHYCALDLGVLGVLVKEAQGSLKKLKHFASNIPDSKPFSVPHNALSTIRI